MNHEDNLDDLPEATRTILALRTERNTLQKTLRRLKKWEHSQTSLILSIRSSEIALEAERDTLLLENATLRKGRDLGDEVITRLLERIARAEAVPQQVDLAPGATLTDYGRRQNAGITQVQHALAEPLSTADSEES